jgi:hypothetical protein
VKQEQRSRSKHAFYMVLTPILLNSATYCLTLLDHEKSTHSLNRPGPSHQAPSSFDDASTSTTWKNKKYVTVTRRKSFLFAWLEAHEHRQDPGENGRRIEHFIGENEYVY